MKKNFGIALFALMVCIITCSPAFAHEFIIKPVQFNAESGQKIPFSVISSGKYEKFCKTLINTGKADTGYDKVIDDNLEIVPITNPALAETGDYMKFKILYDGKPLSTEVFATFDGFSTNPNTYAYFTECNDKGIAKVKITHPGTWMIRVQKKIEQATKDYDIHVMRAVLVFEVN